MSYFYYSYDEDYDEEEEYTYEDYLEDRADREFDQMRDEALYDE